MNGGNCSWLVRHFGTGGKGLRSFAMSNEKLSDDGFSTNCVWWRRTISTRTTRRWSSTSKTSTTIRPSSIDPPTRPRSPKRTTAISPNESYRSICNTSLPTTSTTSTTSITTSTRLHRSFVSCHRLLFIISTFSVFLFSVYGRMAWLFHFSNF